MDVILTDAQKKDIMVLNDLCNIYFDCNKEKRFSVQIARSNYIHDMTYGSFVYVPGEEYGGIIKNVITSTALDYVECKGATCRGMLDTKIIQPDEGADYYIVNGDVYDVIREIISDQYDDLIRVKTGKLGVSVLNYRFDRYCSYLKGITKMLGSEGYKLIITVVRNNDESPYFELSASPIIDYSGDIDFTNDNEIHFTMEDDRGGYNHIIGLGKGELRDRQVVHKYIDLNGNISDYQHYFGADEVVYLYDFSSGESDTFERDVENKLLDLISKPTMSMDVLKYNPVSKIGDIVGGVDYLTGLRNAKKIDNIVYSVEDGKETVDYELEG